MKQPFTWLNPPARCHDVAEGVMVTTDRETDFWRKTHYGFIRDNGHFGYHAAVGDFTAEVTFMGQYHTLYDQAGLMLRIDATRWIKTGIEFVDGTMNFSTVVTNDTSDWSFAPFPQTTPGLAVRARLTRVGATVSTAFQRPGGGWQTTRIAGFAGERECRIGIMCCSPQRAGFEVRFTDFSVGPVAAGEPG